MAASADSTQRQHRCGPRLRAVDLGRHLFAAALTAAAVLLLLAQGTSADCEARRKSLAAERMHQGESASPLTLRKGPAAKSVVEDEPFCLQESISGELSAEGFDATWIGESKLFHAKDGQMVLTDVNTNESMVVLPQTILEQYQPEMMSLSPDERFVLLGYNVRKVYRHSSLANYTIYNVQTNVSFDICDEMLQLAKWAPVGSALAFVYHNNLFYLRAPGDTPKALTSDGVPGIIYNGAADWVYEEEVLASDTALWWSPDGTRVAFARFDDTRVHNASYIHYGTPGKIEDQYGSVVTLRYPKAGTTNPTVQLLVATVGGGRNRVLKAPTDIVSSDHILYTVTWAGRDTVLASWANRVANVVQFVSYNVASGSGSVTGKQGLRLARPDGWLEATPAHFRAGSESSYVTVSWEEDDDDDDEDEVVSFPQVVLVTAANKKPLTTVHSSVTEVYGWDPNGYVWYQATEKLEPMATARSSRPSRRQVFAVKEGGSPVCVSCEMMIAEGQPCRYASASFSSDYSWMALTCSGPMDPPVVTLLTTASLPVRAREARKVVWKDNAELRQKLAPKMKPQQVDTWVEVGGGVKAQVRMLLPPGLDTSGAEQRPALVHVYAGPGSQQISDAFTVGFQHYMSTYRRYIYIYIDGRGSNYKGDQVLFSVNRHLGNLEIEDQINVTRQLKQKYPYIDGSRTAIWGWSYGGYATAMTLAKDDDNVFKCGVSVAPVSSWIYYDSIYTERYMGLPTRQDNEAGYKAGDVTQLATQFANKTFFLIHGTADDNVHYQHSMMLARALEDAGVLFRQQSYPDQDHSMGSLREHLYTSVDEFLLGCFHEDSPSTSSASRMGGALLVTKRISKFVQ